MSRWLNKLGFKYCENKRSYYTDGHERDDVVKYRDEIFLKNYLKNELRCYRWVNLTESSAKLMEDAINDSPENCSYNYNITTDGTVVSFREYHVGAHPSLSEYVSPSNMKYGGDLSIRRDKTKKPLMIVGQDESTFHQYIF